MTEGSVMVDEGSGIPALEESTEVEETTETTEVSSEDTTSEKSEEQPEQEEGKEEVKLTEKGTKLDPDPKSAVHQELANARKQVKQMEQVLTDPALLRRYAKQNNMSLTEAKAEIKEEKEEVAEDFTADQFKTGEDVAKGMNEINKVVRELRQENSRLREGQKGINSSREADRIFNNLNKDVASVREAYPELNPTSPDFNKELESSIGELYQELDLDPATKAPMGKVSVKTIADKVMKAAGLAKKQGSKEAQTKVIVKQAGKVTSGKSKKAGAVESSDPGTAIAQKIAKAYSS